MLSSDDPIRVFQQFATVDLISNGRAEIMAGRGSFIESFPLFGYDLHDYDALFDEKLELLLELRESEVINRTGEHRAPITASVYPAPVQEPLPLWVAVGGTPTSAARAGAAGAADGARRSSAARRSGSSPFAEIHRRAAAAAGHGPLGLSINSHTYVGDPDDFFPGYAAMMTRIGRERGWPPMQRPSFDALRTLRGALVVGSVDEVVEKILYQHEQFGHTRFLAQTSVGSLPHDKVLRSIELLGTDVAPRVRAALG